ncbi:MAG: hypothetical protein JWO77_2369 [Ilumatobacteraceae bacterium]|nr:hypothetical protein [Ilumatobacteraceae bacterium]
MLVLLASTAPVVVATRLFPVNSPDRDDVGYLSQANALRSGELTLPAEENDPFFLPFLSGVEGDRVVFKYQPVWPALIAASEVLTGSPKGALAVTGLASALAVAALAFEVTRRRRAALVAGYLFATSPWFLVQSGTYLAYPASAALLFGATALVLRAVRTGRDRLWVGAGALMALGVFHRPFDAVLGLAPLAIWFLITQRRSGHLRRDVGGIAVGAAPFALLFFAYNRAVTGRFLTLAFSLVGPNDTFGFGPRSSLADPGRAGFYDFTPGEAWRTVLAFAASLTDWLPGGLLVLVLAVLGVRALRGRSLRWLLLAQGLVFPLGYFVWWGAANAWSYQLHLLLGPLYWFPLLGTVAVLGAVAVERLSTDRPGFLSRLPGAAVAVAVVAGLVVVSFATSGDTRRDLKGAREGQEREIDTLRPGPGERTLTIAPPNFEVDIYLPVPVPRSFDADHLVAMDPTAGDGRFDLLDRFPGRTVTEVLRVHDLGKPFDVAARVRRELSVTTAPTIDLAVETFGPGTPYAGIAGEEQPVLSEGGRVDITLAAEPTPGAITVPEGDPVWVVVGLEDFELHWLARTVDGEVQLIEPPTPVRHYHFEGHAPVDVIEDTSIRIHAV